MDAFLENEAVGNDFALLQRAFQSQHCPVRLGIAEIGEHQRVAVDDSRRGRIQRGDAMQLGLERERLLACHRNDVGDAIRVGFFLNGSQFRKLGVARRHDQLPGSLVGHAVAHAVFVKKLPARDAAARLERSLRVVDAGVDHLGIARAGVRADGVFALENDDLAPGEREGARDREADRPGADHDRVKLFHGPASFRRQRRRRPPRRPRWPWGAKCRRR